MGERPENTTLDRIDGTKGYYRENCRWASNKEQILNRKNTVFITYGGETLCAYDWSLKLGGGPTLVSDRIHSGWNPEKAVSVLPCKRIRKTDV